MSSLPPMGRIFLIVFRTVCYLAFAFVLAGIAATVMVSMLGVCPRFDTGAIQCASRGYTALAEFGMAVLLVSVFSGLPFLFAFGGFIFLIVDVVRFIRRRRAAEAA